MNKETNTDNSVFTMPKDVVRVAFTRNTVPTGRKVIGPAMPLRQANPTKKNGGMKK